jgi:hypothetical protein
MRGWWLFVIISASEFETPSGSDDDPYRPRKRIKNALEHFLAHGFESMIVTEASREPARVSFVVALPGGVQSNFVMEESELFGDIILRLRGEMQAAGLADRLFEVIRLGTGPPLMLDQAVGLLDIDGYRLRIRYTDS